MRFTTGSADVMIAVSATPSVEALTSVDSASLRALRLPRLRGWRLPSARGSRGASARASVFSPSVSLRSLRLLRGGRLPFSPRASRDSTDSVPSLLLASLLPSLPAASPSLRLPRSLRLRPPRSFLPRPLRSLLRFCALCGLRRLPPDDFFGASGSTVDSAASPTNHDLMVANKPFFATGVAITASDATTGVGAGAAGTMPLTTGS